MMSSFIYTGCVICFKVFFLDTPKLLKYSTDKNQDENCHATSTWYHGSTDQRKLVMNKIDESSSSFCRKNHDI